ncbi:hypothetical protein BCT41_08695 [Vibrio splendidus]|nr:hypothetical protein BCT41_08695 [Vibrio splendidus]
MEYIINRAIAAAPARRYVLGISNSMQSAMQQLTLLLEKTTYESALMDGLRFIITHPCGKEERVNLLDICKLQYGRCADCKEIMTFEDNRYLDAVYDDSDYDREHRCTRCLDQFFGD